MKICMPKALLSRFIPADYKHFKILSLILPHFFFFMVMKGAGDAVRQQDRELKSLMFYGVGWEGSFKTGRQTLDWRKRT